MFCSNCGAGNKEGAKFCTKCGEELAQGSGITSSNNSTANTNTGRRLPVYAWIFIYTALSFIVIYLIWLAIDKNSHRNNPKYVEVETVEERIGAGFIVLHEAIGLDERMGLSENSVTSPLYHKNEGWLLRNQTIYCSNRLIDDIDDISEYSGINKYSGNPSGERFLMDIETFKRHLISLDEICVNEAEFNGEKVLEATLFVDPDKKIWKKVN